PVAAGIPNAAGIRADPFVGERLHGEVRGDRVYSHRRAGGVDDLRSIDLILVVPKRERTVGNFQQSATLAEFGSGRRDLRIDGSDQGEVGRRYGARVQWFGEQEPDRSERLTDDLPIRDVLVDDDRGRFVWHKLQFNGRGQRDIAARVGRLELQRDLIRSTV